MKVGEAAEKPWDLLLDGVLEAALSLVHTPCDPEIKFYALGALTVALQCIYRRIQVYL